MRLALAPLLLLAACQESRLPTEADIGASRGAALFAQSCTSCHGTDARGGIGPDLTMISSRNGGTFPTDRVRAQIDGMGRHGNTDAVMPEFGAAGLGDTVVVEENGLGVPVPADLLALTAYLESLQR